MMMTMISSSLTGVKVMLVTDDHPLTARAVAQSLGIISPESKTVEQLARIMGREPSEIKPRAGERHFKLVMGECCF